VLRRTAVALACAVSLAVAVTPALAGGAAPDPIDCVGPAGDPAPGTAAWHQRDLANVWCATQREQDELDSPAFASAFARQTPGIYATQLGEQLQEPTRPRLTLGQLVAGGTTADPFRTLSRWQDDLHRGRVFPVQFTASDGALLHGHVFLPSGGSGPYPSIVITTGSIQGYQQMYWWAAEGLAEAGYLVLTFDVQGQGASETFAHPCSATACPGVPFQQDYNFVQGTRDALNYLFSSPSAPTKNGDVNPFWASVDRKHVGLAGHSLGATAVSVVGQEDRRVSAIVAWDNLATPPKGTALRTPAMGINSEYFFNPQPMQAAPDPHADDAAFRQLRAAGVDTMQVALRGSTHLEYSYVPYILPASRLGERVAFYYTLAWFDRYLRGDRSATERLTATRFDKSSDVHSIGAGPFDPQQAAAAGNVEAGNTPPTINGMPVADRLSFYYLSGYSLEHGRLACQDLRHGCHGSAGGTSAP